MSKPIGICSIIAALVLLAAMVVKVEFVHYFEYPSLTFCRDVRISGMKLFAQRRETFLSEYISRHRIDMRPGASSYFLYNKKEISILGIRRTCGGLGNDISKFNGAAQRTKLSDSVILHVLNLLSQGKIAEFQREVWDLYYNVQ